ncbi:MAG: pilus assembly protein N-terminal domain-containing protein [Pseudomonadota bacterium]
MRFLLLSIVAALTSSGASAEQLWVTMDQVRPYTLEKEASEIVVGNPGIADVTVQDNKRILLFGKAPGLTNVFVFDEEGGTIDNLVIRVRTPQSEMLTYQRGAARMTFNCTVYCEIAATVGDEEAAFQAAVLQAQQKFQQAAAAGQQ